MTAPTRDTDLTLRERKKLRTRRALVEEALRLFTRQGFGETTLDELVAAVDVSQRTFFRNFSSKEDVALAPEKELWAAYVAEIERRPPSRAPLEDYEAALFASVRGMAEGWEGRFVASRALCDRTPALVAHSLRHCADVTERVLDIQLARGCRGDDGRAARLRHLILMEIMLTAWHWAVGRWSAEGAGRAGRAEGADRDALCALMTEAFEAIPGALALAEPEPEPESWTGTPERRSPGTP
ncbi:TetR/AcrR family transcriptional regulator [Streptomyces radicis]|uniref:TetR/AcrR family transcriptional regulator n=1 Tax=Streptomyces radicis TaxID=1750517 RepID=A0A3A9W7K9_9ACTN|nr:TetR/AcrR family transcriptional regulator [Streptomyces radicis]RKN08712.1 TetR/AcrR family transcriptional regulator [Streptomyces radicis]RKN21870.1 TetR/AcrR family transcriptional regulator [Streptomyces radicis]